MMATMVLPHDVSRYLAEIELIAMSRQRALETFQICNGRRTVPPPKSCLYSSAQRSFSSNIYSHDCITSLLLSAQQHKRKFDATSIEQIRCDSPKMQEHDEESSIGSTRSVGSGRVSPEPESAECNSPPPAKRAKYKDIRWQSNFEELTKYKTIHGHCIVPRGYSANPRLASWVAEQRKQRKLLLDGKQSSMVAKRAEMLDEIGFVWNAQETAWERQLGDLKQFRKEEGHCLVPVGHMKYPKLGSWVKEQRRHFVLMNQGKQSNMTEERAAKLDAIGFCWNTHEALWLERYHELTEYKKVHGHAVVPTKCAENQRLGTWVHHQRREYKKYTQGKPSHMTAERIKSLESMGFLWFPRDHGCSNSFRSGSISPSESMLSSSSFLEDEKLDTPAAPVSP